jgi:hypothetical protein
MSPFVPIIDPFPSKNQPAKPPYFYDRPKIFGEVLTYLRAGESVSIVGERKAGKSSFLNYLEAFLPKDEFLLVKIDTQEILPQSDQLFLGYLSQKAAIKIKDTLGLSKPIKMMVLNVSQEKSYQAFHEDLYRLREILSQEPAIARSRLVWLIDEIEVLRGYKDSYLYTFLRPLALNDPVFRMVVAGYDVLYGPESKSSWPEFFNAFRTVMLGSLPVSSARNMINDAFTAMKITGDGVNVYKPICEWTGQKPYFLKWMCAALAETLNRRQVDNRVTFDVLDEAKEFFLDVTDIRNHFAYLWGEHTTEGQRIILSTLSSINAPLPSEKILEVMKEHKLIAGDKQALQHLTDDLSRLEQQGFLNKSSTGLYMFSSDCLQSWVRINKPL